MLSLEACTATISTTARAACVGQLQRPTEEAAYRFFANERISEANILAGHFDSTRKRFAASSKSPVLVLHDTTELSYRHEDTEPIGIVMKTQAGPPRPGRPWLHTRCGILMHSSLVITQSGQPLGLAAIKFWSRDKFHRANALKRKINPTRVPIEKKESIRWLENVRHHVDKERVRDLGTDWNLVGIGATTWARAVDRIQ